MSKNLIIRQVDDDVVAALKLRAAENGRSQEGELREILREVLLGPPKVPFNVVLASMPNVGEDADFERIQ